MVALIILDLGTSMSMEKAMEKQALAAK